MSWISYSAIVLGVWLVAGLLVGLFIGWAARDDSPAELFGQDDLTGSEAALDELFREDAPTPSSGRDRAPRLTLERRAHSIRIVRR